MPRDHSFLHHKCGTDACTVWRLPRKQATSCGGHEFKIDAAICINVCRYQSVVSDFDLPAATISSYHIVAACLAVGRSPLPVRCPAWRPQRPIAQCRQLQEDAKDASVSECTWTLSALEALHINLRLTYLLITPFVCRTTTGARTFFVAAPHTWNTLRLTLGTL